MTARDGAAGLLLAATALVLAGCVATGPQPEEAIPPALLESDLGILEAEAGTSLDGFSVSVWVSFLVERDSLSAADLREVIAITVDNTHVSNLHTLVVYGDTDEIDPESAIGDHMPIDLEPPAEELGLELIDSASSGTGAIEVAWDDALAMLEATE